MSTNKFTDGPWGVPFLDDDYSSRQEWITGPDGALIATIEACDNMDANARLISCAPELLAACQLMIDYDSNDATDDGVAMMLAYSKAVESAKAAIAKATGDAA